MKITIEHHGEKFSYETESDALDSTELVDALFNLCVSAGYHRNSIADSMHEKVCQNMDEGKQTL
jgi:hypothetical protein|tara:strand:- start:3673 stop:3864 length:192 start_codon:yes stop_codon:yes gene_type:complete